MGHLSTSYQLANVHRPLGMAQFIWFSIVLLPLLGYPCRSQLSDARSGISGRGGFIKDDGYGRPVLAMANSPRCTFNGKPVEDGKTVSSPEPCLNCTCSKGILLCYLHTCNSIAPTPGCEIVKKPGTCCPQLECEDSLAYLEYWTEKTNKTSNKYRVRQDNSNFFGLFSADPRTDRSATVTSTTRRPSVKGHRPNFSAFLKGISSKRSDTYGQSPYEQEEDIEEDELSPDRNNSAGYCYSRGYKYAEGMAMLSPTKCEYCYCISGQQMCVRPKCHLNIEGCVPRYQSGYTCCPSHYNCEIASGASALGNEDVNHQTGSVSENQLKNKVTSCNVEGYDFDVGVAVPSSGHCQTCYCTQVGVVCRRLECSPIIPGCTPVVPEGHCCPTQYKCDQKHLNSSHIPVPHSTDNYDVTVISTSDSEGTSSQASRTEQPDIYTETAEDSPTTYVQDPETTTETSSEKQKITVELPGESDLESISVIPEENIAVLVLTTEKDSNEGKTASAEITSHTSTREDVTTKLVATSILNAKRRSKPTKTSTVHSKNRNPTRFTTLSTVTNPLTITTNGEVTTRDDSNSVGKETDSYAYDYEELYEDTSPDTKETFSPFSDYSLTPFEETSSTGSSQETSSTHNIRHKIKQKRPQTSTFSHQPTTSIDSSSTVSDESFNYGTKNTEFGEHDPSYSTIARGDVDEIISDDPNKYTLYSSDRTRSPDTTTNTETLITRPNIIQKHKNRRPGLVTKNHSTRLGTQSTKPTQLVTGSKLTLEEIFNLQTLPFDTTTERKTFPPHTTETSVQTYSPYGRPAYSHKKKISNRRQPESRPGTVIPHKTVKPLPQDITEFLWSVTQLQNTETTASSTETGDSTPKKVIGQSLTLETLPPIALAAPKLIMEAATSESTQGTTEVESANETTNPPAPSFNFQAPEIIFSNHGPSHTRKQPPVVRGPNVPLIINNHKKTSTRIRPPILFRPPSTPATIEDTLIEISNHRPTNSLRRPPSNFPPYPHAESRLNSGHYRDPHIRDSHPKHHRIDSNNPPVWPDDYEEYYYDSEHDRSTKIYNNILPHQSASGLSETSNTHPPLTGLKVTSSVTVSDLPTETVSLPINGASTDVDKMNINYVTKTTPNIAGEMETNRNTNTDAVPATETGLTATTVILTTPLPKTSYYLPTITTSAPVDTTKSFSGYVRNKYKGISSHIRDNEPKFFRADEDTDANRRESDYRLIDFGKKHKSPTVVTEAPTQPTKEQDDSQEITDVCFVDGRYYTSGETIIKSNPCEMCRCFYGHPLCQVQQCPTPPDPTCALDYLPGYCCPQVTCGLETDPDQPPGIVSMPEPTSQEIRRSDMDNQWKPLPHGPLVRTTESAFKVESTALASKQSDVQPVIETFAAPDIQMDQIPSNNNMYVWAGESNTVVTEPTIEQPQVTTTSSTTTQATTTSTTTEPTTTIIPTTEQPTTITTISETTTTPSSMTEIMYTYPTDETTVLFQSSTTVTASNTEDVMTVPYVSTKAPRPLEPVFDQNLERNRGSKNKSGIHDNSSGVRKILDEVITLPPSKFELSLSDGSDISTVLPVIVTIPTTTVSAEDLEKEPVTMSSDDLVGVVTELGGNLKVSGCNVYGKYYRINDKVTVLSKPCSDCICSADGIACNATC